MRFFTNERPLGPNQTPEVFHEGFTHEEFRTLFDRENEIYKSLSRNPRILIGRRGSGKTAFLKSRSFINRADICVELHSTRAFTHVVSAINSIMDEQSVAFAEDAAAIWTNLFSMVMFRAMLLDESISSAPESTPISAYFQSVYGNRDAKQFNLFLTTLARELLHKATGLKDIWQFIEAPTVSGPTLQDALIAADSVLRQEKRRVQILVDNLDDYSFENLAMQRALAGLLKAIREFSEQSQNWDVTFCLPAELLHIFQEQLSSNPLKDFERRQLLQWTGRELVHLAANRYAHFLELQAQDFYAQRLARLDLNDRDDAREFWTIVFPATIENSNGVEEDALAYLLRHTQLSPRHLIMVMNEVISFNIFQYGTCWNIRNDSFVTGVRNVETLLCDEAFRAYRDLYPCAQALCEVILPHCAAEISYAEVHKIYNSFGRSVSGVESFYDALRQLIEIGALGLVSPGESTARYTVGTFEYTLQNRLIVNSEDRLCVHPVFLRRFRVKTKGLKPVYPYGCDLTGNDYRAWSSGAEEPPRRTQGRPGPEPAARDVPVDARFDGPHPLPERIGRV